MPRDFKELLTPKEKERIEKLPKRVQGRFKGDYIEKDEQGRPLRIKCRCCQTLIADTINGQCRTLGNYRMVELRLQDNGAYTTNMCADCAKQLDTSDPDTMEALWLSDVQAWAKNDALANVDPEKRASTVKLNEDRKIKLGCKKRTLNAFRLEVQD